MNINLEKVFCLQHKFKQIFVELISPELWWLLSSYSTYFRLNIEVIKIEGV